MKPLYKHQETYYKILRSIPMHQFPTMEFVKEYRDLIGSNHVLKNGSKYLFCEVIEEAKIIEYVSPDNNNEEE